MPATATLTIFVGSRCRLKAHYDPVRDGRRITCAIDRHWDVLCRMGEPVAVVAQGGDGIWHIIKTSWDRLADLPAHAGEGEAH